MFDMLISAPALQVAAQFCLVLAAFVRPKKPPMPKHVLPYHVTKSTSFFFFFGQMTERTELELSGTSAVQSVSENKWSFLKNSLLNQSWRGPAAR